MDDQLTTSPVNPPTKRFLTHTYQNISIEETVEGYRDRISKEGDLPHVYVERRLETVDQLAEFEFGRFLLQNKGLNGYWTDYILLHPRRGRLTQLNSEGVPFSEMEDFLLNRAPTFLATQQRFEIFQEIIQLRFKEKGTYCSLPCGLMNDLMLLDVSGLDDFTFVGIDVDSLALHQARRLSEQYGLEHHVEFVGSDAWHLPYKAHFDLLSSNGLNLYEEDDEKVTQLYKEFYKVIKPGGLLVTSFLTPPPSISKESGWLKENIVQEDLKLQRIIFTDVLEAKWQHFRTFEETKKQLEAAGFTDIKIWYDHAQMFPTVVCRKS